MVLHGDRAFDEAKLFRNGDFDTMERPGDDFAHRLDVVTRASSLNQRAPPEMDHGLAGLSSNSVRDQCESAERDLFIVGVYAPASAPT